MDVILETVPGGAQNEHVVIESPHDWLPRGARVFLDPPTTGYDNTMLFEGERYHIRNVRVIDGHQPDTTRTALEVLSER